mmetsp:Transcript_11500/g.34626  ORF Transcript_11500/g.34626 Transcript_11500/m.34626 type:complete len:837 (-) Transcript_11500:25-2535(-)
MALPPEFFWALTETLIYLCILLFLIIMLKVLVKVARQRMLPRPKYVATDATFTDYARGQNWSWDWCLVFPVRNEHQKTPWADLSVAKQRRLEHYSMRYVIERLETGAGLETKLFRSHDRSLVFCKIRASSERLKEEAARTRYTLMLCPSEVRRRIEAGGPVDALGAASWYPRRNGWALPERPTKMYDTEIRDEFQQSSLSYEAYIYGRYDPQPEVASAYATHLPGNSIFTGVDRLKLILSIMEADAKSRGAQIDVNQLVEAKVLEAAYPLHADGELFALMDRWITFRAKEWAVTQPVEAIKDYFGERIGMYFYFNGYYARWLLYASAMGLFAQIIMLAGLFRLQNIIVPCYAVAMSLWTTLFLETWKERQVEKAMQWGMTGFAVSERPRPQFEGREIHSPVTGLPELYFPTAERFRLRAWSYVAMFWTLVLVFGVFACIMTAEAYFSTRPLSNRIDPGHSTYDDTGMFLGELISQISMALAMFAAGALLVPLARRLNEYENHKTDTEFENHLISKVFVLQFATAYGPLFYIATVMDYMPAWTGKRRWGCRGSEGCFDDVQTQLAIIFCVRILARNLIDVVVPSLVILRRERREQDLGDEYENPTDPGAMRKRQTSPTEEQFRKEHYHHLFGTFNDYSEIVIQFGYTTLFAVAFPLAPLFAYVNSFVGLRTDAFKICHNMRRPWPTGCATIGSWLTVLDIVSYTATVTNALLVTFTGGFLANRTLFVRFLFFLLYEFVLLGVKIIYLLLRDDVPFEVELQVKRARFLTRKIVADEPDAADLLRDDSDDDDGDGASSLHDSRASSSHAYARTSFAVHDRDPEERMAALKDPDAFGAFA